MSITVHSRDESQLMNSVVATTTRDWLTSNWSADKYVSYTIMRTNPLIRSWFDINQGWIDNQEYMNRHGISWRDTTHPWRLPGNASFASGVNYVSDNLKRLYR